MHTEISPLAGKTVKIKKNVCHHQFPDFGGSEIRIEDWWDRAIGKSWMDCEGNPGCMAYALRIGLAGRNVPYDDEVLYGKRKDGLGSLVHESELEEVPDNA